ncbi:MAG: anthranilate synthase component I [Gammaproteobacteria bacterium]|nr:anthranilate synthase component I [Gammaproteobacteria bacterium]
MSPDQFRAFAAQGYNHIPVAREVLSDLDTPLSAYLKLAGGPRTYLLESVQGGEKWGRYSMIGLAVSTQLIVRGNVVTVEVGSKVVSSTSAGDPFAEIGKFRAQYRVPVVAGLPRFSGGLVGYFGYDCVNFLEPRLGRCPRPDPLACPDVMLLVSDRVVVFDNLTGKGMLIVHADPGGDHAYEKAIHDLDLLEGRLRSGTVAEPESLPPRAILESDFSSAFPRGDFEESVRRIQQYIVEGDVMQVVLSQRMSVPVKGPPINIYRALRSTSPSPYMYFLNLGDFQIVGASPEVLARLEDGIVTVRPIAGTRPRGTDEADDDRLAGELLADPKELAEHLMLIDLGRNDVGRVAETGSVKVTERMVIERYSHVMHIASNVAGRLRRGLNALDVLRATFPAGTVSGAPKVRAMEIIEELEAVRRGVYSGAVGYLSWAGNMDTAIAIRTAVIKGGMLHIQAGAGVVADSDPAREWEETMNKGRAMFRAVALAEGRLAR